MKGNEVWIVPQDTHCIYTPMPIWFRWLKIYWTSDSVFANEKPKGTKFPPFAFFATSTGIFRLSGVWLYHVWLYRSGSGSVHHSLFRSIKEPLLHRLTLRYSKAISINIGYIRYSWCSDIHFTKCSLIFPLVESEIYSLGKRHKR